MSIAKEIFERYKAPCLWEKSYKDKTLYKKLVEGLTGIELQQGAAMTDFGGVWGHCGRNCFSLTNELVTTLIATDPLAGQDIKLPYLAFILDLDFLSLGFNQIFFNGNFWVDEQVGFWLSVTVNKTESLYLQGPFKNLNNFIDYNGAFTKNDKQQLALAHRIVYNFILWLNATNPKLESSTPKLSPVLKTLKMFKNLPQEWIIGRNVKVSKELKEATEALIVGTGNPVTGVKPGVRFMVRGHFRKQPCGPQRTLRKLIWVEPFMKGPEGAEAWAHIYKSS